MPKRLAHRSLAGLTALLVLVTAVSGYARFELADRDAFAARAAAALDDDAVRAVVAERLADGIATARPEVLAARPLVVRAADALVGTAAFRRLFELSVREAHGVLVGGQGSVVIELERGGALIVNALRRASPRVAREVPARVEPRLARLSGGALEIGAIRTAADLASAFWWLLCASVIAAVACAATAAGARAGVVTLSACVAAAGGALPVLVTLVGAVIVPRAARAVDLEDGDEEAAVAALWNALLADLRSAGLIAAVAATVVAVAASAGSPTAIRAAAARRIAAAATATAPSARAARAALLIAAGAGLVLAPDAALSTLAWGAGAVLIVAGAAEIAAAPRRRATVGAPAPRPALAGAAVAGTVVACALVGLALVLPAPNAAPATPRAASGACNGSLALCGKRIDEVVFPATHNSYSAAAQPDWFLTNQRFGIERQLRDGIRGLLIDVHAGVRDPDSGRVRTDLRGEGQSRNKVTRELSPAAVRQAERLAGRVGIGELRGPRGTYLCHALCELGAEPLDDQLQVVASFLAANRGEVVVLFVEPYVGVAAIERSLERADLVRQAARLRLGDPLPTLGDLVRADTRLIVLAEEDGGERDWYLPGFDWVQDTPLTDRGADEASCERGRGTPRSPLLLVNHWADAYPPTATRNARIGGRVLADRLDRCERRRRLVPNLVAVDFYERTGVVEIARDLNARPR